MRKLLASTAVSLVLCGPALADTMEVAVALGGVLASEEPCGLSYDQQAIASFVEERVAAEDLRFASLLQTMTSGSSVQIERMSVSSLTAHCAQVTRVARHYGFID